MIWRSFKGHLAVVLGLVFALVSREGLACGASAGSGGVSVCTVEELREEARKKWHVGVAYSFTNTDLFFNGGPLSEREAFEQERHAAWIVGEWRATPRFNLQLGAGSLLGGFLDHPTLLEATGRIGLDPGFVGMVGSSFVAVKPRGAVPFVLLTGQFSGIVASTSSDGSYHAFDLRLGTSVGWTLFRSLSPYVVGRVFGGPATWKLEGETLTGTDKYHYQLGAGLSYLIAYRVDLYVEGIALGERGLSAGVGVAF